MLGLLGFLASYAFAEQRLSEVGELGIDEADNEVWLELKPVTPNFVFAKCGTLNCARDFYIERLHLGIKWKYIWFNHGFVIYEITSPVEMYYWEGINDPLIVEFFRETVEDEIIEWLESIKKMPKSTEIRQ